MEGGGILESVGDENAQIEIGTFKNGMLNGWGLTISIGEYCLEDNTINPDREITAVIGMYVKGELNDEQTLKAEEEERALRKIEKIESDRLAAEKLEADRIEAEVQQKLQEQVEAQKVIDAEKLKEDGADAASPDPKPAEE